ncbi:MAG: DNA-binding protein [Candidatus Bathyarchaeia archaeon]|nr:DNA-binding protein [Candidatus Bathyarchaeota archaeon]
MSEEVNGEELESIKRRKLAQLQRALIEEQRKAELKRQLEIKKQEILRQILTTEARQRLANIKMVKPEFAEQLELQLIQIAQTGRIPLPINDEQLKMILAKIQSQRREFKIKRI